MADIDQVRDKNHEGDNMANQHGAIIVFTEHMTETKKKGKVNKSQSNLIEKRKRTPSEDVQDNEAKKKLMRCVRILDGLEGIGGGPFTKALKILKEDPLWRDVFLALSDDRKKDFVLNL
ncbi:unnamed protein product [Trifolium pratense]|uniref:Uncharacterized protein n=1 Tax=Trifolium pratense TaxID=57577 RepID=A0ACB0LFL8_TRIPR|nr:unnamed protein product [Trifolium pratense]